MMKQKLWLTIITGLAYCIDKELYKAIDHLKKQVQVLIEQAEMRNNRILLTDRQLKKVAAKAKRLSKKILAHCTVLFVLETILGWFRKLIVQKYNGSSAKT